MEKSVPAGSKAGKSWLGEGQVAAHSRLLRQNCIKELTMAVLKMSDLDLKGKLKGLTPETDEEVYALWAEHDYS